MERIALISDIHGNAIALDSCLRQISAMNVDATYFLGDAVGYMSGDKEVMACLSQHAIPCQKGNHEAMLLSPNSVAAEKEEVYRLGAARERLDQNMIDNIKTWPLSRVIDVAGKNVLLVHTAPDAELYKYVYPDSDLTCYADLLYDAVFMGHTHRPFISRVGGKVFANVGSVGQPRDVGNLASFAVYDGGIHDCTVYRIPFINDKILQAYGADMHISVWKGLQRRESNVVGELIT